MKRIVLSMICLVSIHFIFAQGAQKLEIGSDIPMASEKLKSVDGKSYSIKDAASTNGTIVMFSCNTCPYVVKYQTRTKKLIAAAKEKGFGIIIFNSNEAYRDGEDSYEAMIKYAASQGYKDVPYVVDVNSAVADAFSANRTPECFVFSAEGKLVYHGAMDSEPNNVDTKETILINALSEIAAGKEVSVKESRSIGCSIKRKDS